MQYISYHLLIYELLILSNILFFALPLRIVLTCNSVISKSLLKLLEYGHNILVNNRVYIYPIKTHEYKEIKPKLFYSYHILFKV